MVRAVVVAATHPAAQRMVGLELKDSFL